MKQTELKHVMSINEEATSESFDDPLQLSGIARPRRTDGYYGTFLGVYIPCVLAMSGVVFFLRLGFLVGQAGSLFIVALLCFGFVVVGTTTLSLSAICTNGHMLGGGVYYMISRNLGPEFGSTIGLILIILNIVNSATFMLGFTEVLMTSIPALPSDGWFPVLYASSALCAAMLLAFVGSLSRIHAAVAVSVSVAVVSGVVSFVTQGDGAVEGFHHINSQTFLANLIPDVRTYKMFQGVFSMSFPALIGIMSGVNNSGKLRDPAFSIPRGTLFALGTMFVMYMVVLIPVLSATCDRPLLLQNYFIMQRVAWNSWVIAQGVMASLLCGGLSCIVGGSRILQALARDNLVPFLSPFASGSPRHDEPRRAILLIALLVQCFVLLRTLNMMLPLMSMFAFTTYGFINIACLALSASGAPNFRPRFKYYSRWTAALGTTLCLGGMFVLNVFYATLAIVLFLVVWLLIHYRAPVDAWSDVSSALMFHQVRKYLLRLNNQQSHVKFWRPSILLLTENPLRQLALLDFTNDLKKGGLYVLGTVVRRGPCHRNSDPGVCMGVQAAIGAVIRQTKIKAFSQVVLSPSVREGVVSLVLCTGLGALKPNTVTLGFYAGHTSENGRSEQPVYSDASVQQRVTGHTAQALGELADEQEGQPMSCEEYVGIINDAISLDKTVLIARHFEKLNKEQIVSKYRANHKWLSRASRNKMTIDVWMIPSSTGANGLSFDLPFQLALQLGYVLQRSGMWHRYTTMRIMTVYEEVQGVAPPFELIRTKIAEFLDEVRITAGVQVVPLLLEEYTKEFTFARSNSKIYAMSTEDDEADAGAHASAMSPREKCAVVNHIIKRYSTKESTAVVLIPIQKPPGLDIPTEPNSCANDNEIAAQLYIEQLEALSAQLPPTLLVYGMNRVITNEV